MADGKTRWLNPERILFGLLACQLVFFGWRAGLFDAPLQAVGLPPAVGPLPEVPMDPQQPAVPDNPLPKLLQVERSELGERRPFEPARDILRVLSARVTSFVKISRFGGQATVDVKYSILPRPVKEFRFSVPKHVRLRVEERDGITLHQLRKKAGGASSDGAEYTVKLRSGVNEKYRLRLYLSWARQSRADILEIPELILPDKTHESGLIIVAYRPPMPVKPLPNASQNVTYVPTDKLTVPSGLISSQDHRSGYRVFAGFEYRTHPYSIKLDVSPKAVPRVVIKRPRFPKGPIANLPDNKRVPIKRPKDPKDGNGEKPKKPVPKPGWKLPVSYMGTVSVTADNTRFVLLKLKDGNPVRVSKGDVVHGMTVIEIRPRSVILKNDKDELFILPPT